MHDFELQLRESRSKIVFWQCCLHALCYNLFRKKGDKHPHRRQYFAPSLIILTLLPFVRDGIEILWACIQRIRHLSFTERVYGQLPDQPPETVQAFGLNKVSCESNMVTGVKSYFETRFSVILRKTL